MMEKEAKLLVNHNVSCFPTLFSTLLQIEIVVLAAPPLSSANALNLVQSINVSFGKDFKVPIAANCKDVCLQNTSKSHSYHLDPLPHIPILCSSNSAVKKNMMSKIWTNWVQLSD